MKSGARHGSWRRGRTWATGTSRPAGTIPVDTILAQNEIRLPELAPLRHQRMALSPWNFYRGAAAVMAADLASRAHSRIEVQLCGDAHVLNFGLWATPERNLNFDLRDFDETLPGPFEWDVARLAASLVVAARENGVKASKSDAAVTAAVDAYRTRMRYYSTLPLLDIWYEGTRFDQFIDYFEPADRGQVKVQFEKKKESRTSRGAFAKLTTERRGRARITPQPPLRVTLDDDEQGDIVEGLLEGYRLTLAGGPSPAVRPLHPGGRRPPGGGGRQRRAWWCTSCCSRGARRATRSSCSASRPVPPSTSPTPTPAGTTTTAPGSSPASAWCRAPPTSSWAGAPLGDRDFYVRQFRDMKLIPTTDLIAPVLVEFAIACGNTLARAHARSGDPEAIDAYMGKSDVFTKAMRRFARRYADQNERDHGALVAAIRRGQGRDRPGLTPTWAGTAGWRGWRSR